VVQCLFCKPKALSSKNKGREEKELGVTVQEDQKLAIGNVSVVVAPLSRCR
jgi:hypothetical protein